MRKPELFPLPTVPTAERDLVALGVSRRRLAAAARDGRLLRIRRGVYLDPARWPTSAIDQHLVLAHAEHASQPDSVISHRSAAAFWGLPVGQVGWADEPVWMTLPPGREFRSGRQSGLVRVIGALPNHQIAASPSGFPVTTVARTAADLVRGVEMPDSLVVLDAALRLICADLVCAPRRSDFGNDRLVAAARVPIEEAMRRWGMRSALQSLALASPVRESPIESLTYGHLVLAGLPLPLCQQRVSSSLGTYFADFYWEQQRLIGEADGKVKYADADAIIAEKEREQALRDLGYRIVRWTGREIYSRPQVVLGRIARALEN